MYDKGNDIMTNLSLPAEYFLNIVQEVDAAVCVVVLLGLRKTEKQKIKTMPGITGDESPSLAGLLSSGRKRT